MASRKAQPVTGPSPFTALLLLWCCCTPPPVAAGFAQDTKPTSAPNKASFYSVAELTKSRSAVQTLRGARLADPKDWPATFYMADISSYCTSTLVGSRALLTAAHCLKSNSTASVRVHGDIYSGPCTLSDQYSPSNSSADWALCLMDKDVPVSPYETVNSDRDRVRRDTVILLTGFGCTSLYGTGGNDGNFRIGEAKVDKVPAENENYIETVGIVALCFGDSGGGAFIYRDSGKKSRLQISVNSTVARGEAAGTLGQRSYLSSLSTQAAQKFLRDWSMTNGVSICGITQGAQNCRE